MKRVAVIGAGIGGLAAALHLRSKGFEVNLFEKNSYCGGKMGEKKINGYRFDTGPSLMSMPHVLMDLFRTMGKDADDYISLKKLDMSCRYFWEDGTVFDWHSDHSKLFAEIKDVFGNPEAVNFQRMLDYGKLFHDIAESAFLDSEFRLRNFFKSQSLKHAGRFISGSSMNDVANKFFKDKRLKQMFNRFATYSGSSPYLTPQFHSMIPYKEHISGPWYVSGGMYGIASAMESLCIDSGVKIEFGLRLTGLKSAKGEITELNFEDSKGDIQSIGEFDDVVLNFTSVPEFTGEGYFSNKDWSSSGFILFAGIKASNSNLSHHNVFFSDDYEEEFIDIFEKGVPAKDMTVYVSITEKEDSVHAPAGCENWFIFVNVPFLGDGSSWSGSDSRKYADAVIEKLNDFHFVFGEDIRNRIEFVEYFTPNDFRELYGSEFGSIYGLSSNSIYTLMRRPKNRSSLYSNLFFTGGNTHPGGGIPLCLLSGKIISELIERKYAGQ